MDGQPSIAIWNYKFCWEIPIFTEIAQANGGNDIEEAVITAPLHFSDEQRTAMRYSNIHC